MSELLPESFEEVRYGGAMDDDGESGASDAQRKAEERERKKAEVRKRLEEAGSKKRAKKGFLTPERKKKLRKLLMMKAAEDLKQQQLAREKERQSALGSRIPALPDIDSINDHGKLESIYNDLFEKVKKLEEEKFDINSAVATKDSEINELTIAVNDLRGKFVKPSLKKVSKYDNKFKKLGEAKTGEKQDFRSQLKVVKKENVLDELVQKKAKGDKPEWSNKNKSEKSKTEDNKPADEDKEEKPTEDSAPAAEEPAAEEEEEEEEEDEEEEE